MLKPHLETRMPQKTNRMHSNMLKSINNTVETTFKTTQKTLSTAQQHTNYKHHHSEFCTAIHSKIYFSAGTNQNGTAFGLQMSQAGFSSHIVEVSVSPSIPSRRNINIDNSANVRRIILSTQ